jgi:DNA-binding winged helix-turn-helix (wHTH) protein/tetratricopeptide (TPR) repeat protein
MSRPPIVAEPARLKFGEFELDEANAWLRRGGHPVELAPTPFRVLCALARRPGALLTKNALLDEVWGHRFVSDSVLKSAISDVRMALGDDARRPRFIETVARRGYRFVQVTVAPATALLPSAVAAEGDTASALRFVGRAIELATLRRAWERTLQGARSVVWIAGEPGIGKSTLVERLVAELGDVACARGYCVEHFGTGEPFLPVLEALGELSRADPALPVLLREIAPMWLLQMPWLLPAEQRETLRRELSGVGPDRMLREAGELLDRYTQQRPLLLVTEDLHWADRATTQLLDYLARRRGRARLMWLGTFRITEVVAFDHPLNALRHELRLHGLCEELVLNPFSEAEVATYVGARAPAIARDESAVRTLHERTDGLPLFVAAVTNEAISLTASGTHGARGAALGLTGALPESLASVLDYYLAKLGDERRSLLTGAAICGADFRVETLARVLQRNPEDVARDCERLVREALWVVARAMQGAEGTRERSFGFRHGLLRQAVYERASPSLRAELHRRAGEALVEARAHGHAVTAAELAMHFDRGRVPLEALRHYADAAEAALQHHSPTDCLTLTERGLDVLERVEDASDRGLLEIRLAAVRGVAAFQALGVGEHARTAFARAAERVSRHTPHPLRGPVLHGLGFVLNLRAEYEAALAVAETAKALAATTDDALLAVAARTIEGHVHLLQGRPGAAIESLESALPMLQGPDARVEEGFLVDPQVTLLALLGLELGTVGRLAAARQRLREAHDRAEALRQPVARLTALWVDALLAVRVDGPERVAALAERMTALVDEFALTQGAPACRWFSGWADARQGRSLDGFRRIRDAYDDNTRLGMVAGGTEVLGYAAEALALHGDFAGARTKLQEALAAGARTGERVYLPQLRVIDGAIEHGAGNFEASERAFRAAIDEARAQGSPWLELHARVELVGRAGLTALGRRALIELLDRLPEAADTPLYARARALASRAPD